ncbi:MFS transporter [Agitococcus lubricus]|uniref:MFS transporter n=1 Tax=Agitococcus lubricus TaxID=1077255 RepID=A0A2T5IZX5_9GAMM|nr:MFS transporter [Agitococcus lubricus]PTQ89617.1 MFS transporter [Agitococcus lubricus]
MTPQLPIRLAVLLSLYVAQGLPTGIFTQALPAILRSYNVSLTIIGFTSLLAIPWALKFLWAPYVDKYYSAHLGRSRSWILPLQAISMALLLVISMFDPYLLKTSTGIYQFFVLMFLLNLFAATQDIASDALAVRSLNYEERGLGNSLQVVGYRLGLIIGGGFLLYLVGVWDWQLAFILMAMLLAIMTLPILFYREPVVEVSPLEAQRPYAEVFKSFISHPAFKAWVWVLITYKVGDGLGSAMVKPMMIDMGLQLQQIGLYVSVLGSMATLLGALMAGWLIQRIGRYKALISFGLLQSIGIGSYALLSWQWQQTGEIEPWLVYGVNAADHWVSGMATVALLTAVMDQCRRDHAGADFTLQVSILAIFGGSAGLIAGVVTDAIGYTAYYLLAAFIALCLLWPVVQWGRWLKR